MKKEPTSEELLAADDTIERLLQQMADEFQRSETAWPRDEMERHSNSRSGLLHARRVLIDRALIEAAKGNKKEEPEQPELPIEKPWSLEETAKWIQDVNDDIALNSTHVRFVGMVDEPKGFDQHEENELFDALWVDQKANSGSDDCFFGEAYVRKQGLWFEFEYHA